MKTDPMNWKPLTTSVWQEFCDSNPEFLMNRTPQGAYNFLRTQRAALERARVISKAQNRTKEWYADSTRFGIVARAALLGLLGAK